MPGAALASPACVVAIGHLGRVGLDLMAAIEAPDDQPHTWAAAALPSVMGGPGSDFTVAVWRWRNGLPLGIGLGLGPLLPVGRRHLVRSEKARIVPGDDSPG
jgi:hypothetical protein